MSKSLATQRATVQTEDSEFGSRIVRVEWTGLQDDLTDEFLAEFEQSISFVEDSEDASVVLFAGLAGAGNAKPQAPDLEHCRKWEEIVQRVDGLPALSLAIIDGECVSFSLQLALACDLRLATHRSTMQMPAVLRGYLPGMSTFRLAKFVGLGVARRLLLTGEKLNAQEAFRLGLVDQVCEADQATATVQSTLENLSKLDGRVVKLARRLLKESYATPFEDAIGHYLAAQHHCLTRLEKEE